MPFKKAFGFLYDGFRQDSAWALCWDSMMLMRRFFIVAVTVLFSVDAYMQAFAACMVTFCFFTLHLLVRPFEDVLLNTCEAVGLIVVLMTQFGSLVYFYGELWANTPIFVE